MANYRLTPDDSYIGYTSDTGRFYYGTAGADSLTVDAGALIYALGEDANGAIALEMDNRAPWTVTINGALWSQALAGLFLDTGVTGTKASTVTVGAEGSIHGHLAGIAAGSPSPGSVWINAPIVIKVDGEVSADFDSADAGAGIYFNTTGAHTVTNTGSVTGYWGIYSEGDANDTITNSGFMNWVVAGGGTNKLVNTGRL